MSRLSLEHQVLQLGGVDPETTGGAIVTDSHSASSDEKHSGNEDTGKRPLSHAEGQNGTHHLDDAFWEPAEGVIQDDGVTKIEALYIVFGKGWGLFALWLSIGLISYVYALSQSTTYYYEQFATSSFGQHTLLGTISVITSIMSGVAQPFIAKLADVFSRPIALTISVVFYFVGYAVAAGARNVKTFAGGQVIYTLGNTGINFVNGLLIADITSLQWRGFVQGAVSLPFVVNAFVAGEIASGINAYSNNGWRWGYGMFCILVPVCISPAVITLFIGDFRAKKLGALSLAAPSYYRRQVIAGIEPVKPSKIKVFLHYWTRLNGFGLLLLGFAFGCILTPFTLSTTAKGGYNNPSLIALLVVGGVLFIGWVVWDGFFAPYPIMPRRVLNKTFLSCVVINFMYYFSGYLTDTYISSWVYIIVNWSDKDYTYYNNILTVGLCGFAVIAGLTQRYFHRYKWQQMFGLAVRVIGMGLTYASAKNPSDAYLVTSRVLISLGGAITVISTQVASQGSVPHQDLAIAISVLSLWTSIGGAISQAISASVWNRRVPAMLEKYVGDVYNATGRAEIFGSIIVARAAEPRDKIIQAYLEAVKPLWLAALCTSFIALGAGCLSKNYYLGDNHNAIEEEKKIRFRSKDEVAPELIQARAKHVQDQIVAEVMNQPNQQRSN